MKKLKYLGLIGGLLLAITSCDDNEPQSFLAEDTFVSFPQPTATIEENATETIKIPIVLAGLPGSGTVTVNVGVSTEGETIPAVEGTDFNILNKTIVFEDGYGTQYVEIKAIDNDEFTGNKAFRLMISSSDPQLKNTVQNSVRVTVVDNEHPLSYLFGLYEMRGQTVSQGQLVTSGYDVLISAHDGSVTEIEVDFGYPEVVLAAVSEEDGETIITFYKNQDVGEAQAGFIAHFVYAFYEGGMYFSEADDVVATYDNGVITLNQDNGFGFLAYRSGAPYAWFENWIQGSVTFTKK